MELEPSTRATSPGGSSRVLRFRAMSKPIMVVVEVAIRGLGVGHHRQGDPCSLSSNHPGASYAPT